MWKSERVRQLIKERGLKQNWLANKCGIGQATLTHLLKGRKPGRPVIKLIAINLGVPEVEIYDPDGDGASSGVAKG